MTRRNYSQEDLTNAVEAIQNGLSFRKAVEQFGVPKTTLMDYSKRETTDMKRIGPPTVLTQEEEDILVHWLKTCTDRGFPRQEENLVREVQKILDADGRDNPFIDNKPGKIIFIFDG